MTFGEHLEQLRKALAKSTIWVGLGLIFGLFVADDVVQYIQTPLKSALEKYYLDQDKARLEKLAGRELPTDLLNWTRANGFVSEDLFMDPQDLSGQLSVPTAASETTQTATTPTAVSAASESTTPAKDNASPSTPEKKGQDSTSTPSASATPSTSATPSASAASSTSATPDASAKPQTTTGSSAKEQRVATVPDDLLVNRLKPVRLWRKVSTKVETLNIQEGFMIWLKAALITGLVVGSPGIFWHIWHFVAAGLYPHERRYVYVFLPLSLGLFLAGVSLAFFVIFGLVIEFLLNANSSLGTDLSPRLNEYVSFALILPLGFGIAFQLPLVMVFLNRIGMFTTTTYLKQWKIAVLVIAFLSMVLTPGGDIYSMAGMGLPLILLYFLGIALCKYLPLGRPLGAEGYDPVA
jgi:sec-independent protein translocase protein TatC